MENFNLPGHFGYTMNPNYVTNHFRSMTFQTLSLFTSTFFYTRIVSYIGIFLPPSCKINYLGKSFTYARIWHHRYKMNIIMTAWYLSMLLWDLFMWTCRLFKFTCTKLMSTREIVVLTCDFRMSTCELLMLTCKIIYVNMRDNYVYMQVIFNIRDNLHVDINFLLF